MLSRAETRRKLANLLAGAIPELVAAYHYKKADLGGQSPVAVVTSNGIRPQQLAADAYWTTYFFGINTLVLYSSTAEGWSEEHAEDLIDTIIEKMFDVLFLNRTSEWWNSIALVDRSFTDEVRIGGVNYLSEVLILEMEMKP